MEVLRDALDALGLALVGHGHEWSAEERSLYEAAIAATEDRRSEYPTSNRLARQP